MGRVSPFRRRPLHSVSPAGSQVHIVIDMLELRSQL